MLNQETKRKIDSARDILVGKVPDPKAQVEQITTAMIYKFMDDMDKESIELGGKARFFTNGFEKYSWSKLMDPKLGGQERLEIYGEAVMKMSQNPHIPQLFRDVFKDAFLPYRNSETLNLFLKEINGFNYEHSEDLGDAFEYLLSILGSQGDAGQFRTPRHIIDFIVSILDPKKDETILDPACGTAGFLISAFKHILKQHKNKPLNPDEKERLMKNFTGYDISPDMVKLSKVNMYLHGFQDPKIQEYDTLTSEEHWDEMFDVILANPPFMTPKGGIRPHKRFSVQANRSEVLFVDYIKEHLRPTGRAGIIVPEGIIFQSAGAYKQLRKILVEDGLVAVISLPSGVFQPYAGVKTSILYFDNSIAKLTDKMLFVKISNDGYDLGAQRREIKGGELTIAQTIIASFKALVLAGKFNEADEWTDVDKNFFHIVSKSKIAESGDFNLSGDHYKISEQRSDTKWELVKIKDICEIGRGRVISKRDIENNPGEYPVFSSQTSDNGCFGKLGTYDFDGEYVTWTTDGANAGTVFYRNGKFNCTNVCGTLKQRGGIQIDMQYLASILNLVAWKHVIQVGNPKLMNNVMGEIKIPLPPLEVQKEIVAEIDGYQKIVDGAKQIVDNYKPTIKIDPAWKKVKIADLVNDKIIEKPLDGNHGEIHPKASDYVQEGIPFIMANDLVDGYVDIKNAYKITEKQAKGLRKGFAKNNDVLITHKGTIGRTAILMSNHDYVVLTPQVTYYRVIDKNVLSNKFLKVYFDSDFFQNRLKQLASIGATRAYIGITDQLDLEIFLPPLNVQKQIVEKIEKERVYVNSAKEMIGLFENQIKEKIKEVWGE